MKKKLAKIGILLSITSITMAAYVFGVNDANTGNSLSFINNAVATEKKSSSSPVKAVTERDTYCPAREDLAPDEMRVIACGTGMLNQRPRQAAACWLVELGNGDKFIFDIGSGSSERLSALKIPYD